MHAETRIFSTPFSTARVEQKVADYAFFEPEVTGRSVKLCVITSSKEDGISLTCHVEDVVLAICKEHDLDWRAITFADLETHRGHQVPSGYYSLEELRFVQANSRLVCDNWIPFECPLLVYETFVDHIGSFWEVEEVVSPTNPLTGKAYHNYTSQQVQEDVRLGIKHLAWLKGWEEKSLAEHGAEILTPEQARKRGYRFNPNGVRKEAVTGSIDGWSQDGAFVDLFGSHLLGQKVSSGFGNHDPYCRPERFSFWHRLNS
jgi:hypothetical protein